MIPETLGVAFVAWPTTHRFVTNDEGLEVQLFEFRSVQRRFHNFAGRRLEGVVPETYTDWQRQLPSFNAPVEDPRIPGVEQVYEHNYELDGEKKYVYDFIPGPHDGWGPGTPIFFAAKPQRVLEAVAKHAEGAPPLKESDLLSAESQRLISQQVGGVLQSGVLDPETYRNMVSFFSFRGLPVKAITTGVSGDGDFVIQGAMERGAVWNLQHELIHTYTSMSLGIAPAAGAAGNLTLGFWWGATEEKVLANMQGGSIYSVGSLVIGVGAAITVYYTMTGHPFGLVVSLRGGPEVEVAGGGGVAYTSFYELPASGWSQVSPWM